MGLRKDKGGQREPPPHPDESTRPRRRRRRIVWIAAALALLLAGALAWTLVEPRIVTVAEYEITSPDVQAALDGTQIVFLTDIHHGTYLSRDRVRSLVDRVNGMHPDLVVLGGDYIHGGADRIEPCFAELARLRAPLGVYGVLGNHDHWASTRLSEESMADAGIEQLDNRGVWIERGGGRIRLGGVGDLWEDEQRIEATTGGTSPDDFVLLLTHNPDYVEELTPGAVDMALAGHTHGGQVTLFGLWAPTLPSKLGQKYRSGLVETGPVPVIVSNGIGSITPPLRFGAPPQIVLVTLRRSP